MLQKITNVHFFTLSVNLFIWNHLVIEDNSSFTQIIHKKSHYELLKDWSYMLWLGQIIKNNLHTSNDDTQIYLALSPENSNPLESLYKSCKEINNWMSQNFLQLNNEKTEVIIIGKNEERGKIAPLLDTNGLKAKNGSYWQWP